MRCSSVRSRLDRLADGELGNRNTLRMMLEHVARCDDCRQELARITALKKDLQRSMRIEAGPEFIATLLGRMEARGIRRHGAVPEARLAKGIAAAVTGIAAAGLILLSLSLLSPGDPAELSHLFLQRLSSGEIACISEGMMLYDTVEYR
ncbi:MAG: zf-HC2 domain-containing protein [Spirochaetes bacterium]|nr:zf-HC2 domain-containing protein [Spirochaetota bacterium]